MDNRDLNSAGGQQPVQQVYTQPVYVPAGSPQYAPQPQYVQVVPKTVKSGDFTYIPVAVNGQLMYQAVEKKVRPARRLRRLSNTVGWKLVWYILISLAGSMLVLNGALVYDLVAFFRNPELLQSLVSGDALYIEKLLRDYIASEGIFAAYTTEITLAASMFGAAFASILPWLGLARENGFRYFGRIGGGTYIPGLIGKAAVVALGVTGAWNFIYTFLSQLMPGSGMDESNMGIGFPETTFGIVIYLVYTCLLAPVFEELIFRGAILKSCSKYGILFSAFASAVCFGLLHGNVQQTPFAFAAGIVLAYVAVRTGSVASSIAVHFIVNATSGVIALIYYAFPSIADYVSIADTAISIGCIVGTVVILCLDGRNISWQPVNEKAALGLLPLENEQPKAKMFHFLTSIGVIAFVVYCLFSIASPFIMAQLKLS